MKFHPAKSAPQRGTDLVFRPSRLVMGLGMAVCLILIGAGVLAVTSGAGLFGVIFTVLGTLVTLPLAIRNGRALSHKSWLLRCNAGQLLIKLASPSGKSSPDDCVLELERSEVEWIRAHYHSTVTESAGEKTVESTAVLEIKPRIADLEPIRQRIAAASKPRTWRGWTSLESIPVRVSTDGLICLVFSDRYTMIAPRLCKAINLLGRYFPVQPQITEHNDFTIPQADKQKMEQQIIELAEQGRLLDASKLARERYGFSLAEASRFVEQLRSQKVQGEAAEQS